MSSVAAQESSDGCTSMTTPSVADEPMRSAGMTTSIGSLQNVPVRFCKTEDGAHIAYVVIGPSDHVAATAVVEQAAGKAPKRKSKMRSTRSVTTPLVLLPGLGMLKEDWADFAFELSKSRLCVMADYRGLGDSMLPNQPPNMEGGKFVPSCSLQNWLTPPQLDIFFESTRTTKLPRLATDVLEIVRDLFWAKHAHGGKAWKRFNLLGHGMGGAVAQTVSLVVMSGSPFENVAFTSNFDPEDPRKEGMGIEHLVLLGASARAVNQGYGGGVFEALSKDDLGEVGALMGYGQDKEQVTAMWRTGRRPRVVIEKQFLSLTSFDYIDDHPLLSLFSLPTLCIHGQHDSQVPYLEGFLVHKRVRGSFWRRVDAGHWLHVGKIGKETTSYVSAFLKDDWDGKSKLSKL